MNVGDMLDRLTNHKLKSTIHQVVNPPREKMNQSRYSIPFFMHPRAEMDVSRSTVPVVRPFELVPALRQLAWQEALLDGDAVAAVANALLDARPARPHRTWTTSARGQALVELACGLSVILMLVFGLIGVARVTSALLGLTAVTREAARVGARAPDAATAFDAAHVPRGNRRGVPQSG